AVVSMSWCAGRLGGRAWKCSSLSIRPIRLPGHFKEARRLTRKQVNLDIQLQLAVQGAGMWADVDFDVPTIFLQRRDVPENVRYQWVAVGRSCTLYEGARSVDDAQRVCFKNPLPLC